jgi:uncharacterized protein YraI
MMNKTCSAVITVVALTLGLLPKQSVADEYGKFEVVGVEDGDMLKLRAGPGIGYKVIIGLPNGTALKVYSCQQTGGTAWCSVSLQKARSLKGHVSRAYLQRK